MGILEIKWIEVEKDGLPQSAITCICIVRAATALRLMRFVPDKQGWITVGYPSGGINKSVTHWHKIPEPPKALLMNILIKKAGAEGLDDDEKLELAQLLRDSV
jgi:hypothetical protein